MGLMHLGNGAPIASMLWGCIAIFAMRNDMKKAAISSAVALLLVLFGFIHAPTVGFAQPLAMKFVYAYGMLTALFAFRAFTETADIVTE